MRFSKIKNRFRSNFLSGAALGFGLFTSALLAVAVSGTFNTFSNGQLIQADEINTNFATLKTAIESIPTDKTK